MRAITIALEGSDGAGKATQSKMLAEYFISHGKKVAQVSFPRYGKTLGGKLLEEVLKSERAPLYDFSKTDPVVGSALYAIDRFESKAYIEELIENNDVLIFDRYVESNLLHQGGKYKTEEERIAFAKFLFNLEYGTYGLPNPQMIVYLTLPFEVTMARALSRAEKLGGTVDHVEKDVEYVKQGHDAGIFYAKHFGWRLVDCVEEGTALSPEDVHTKVLESLRPNIEL